MTTYSHPPIPSLWSDDEVSVREDGFLILQYRVINSLLPGGQHEQQPLLLHSTEIVLQALYPALKNRNDLLAVWPMPLDESSTMLQDAKNSEEDKASKDEKEVTSEVVAMEVEVGEIQDHDDNNEDMENEDSKDPHDTAQPPPANGGRNRNKKKKKQGKDMEMMDADLVYIQAYQKLKRQGNLADRLAPLINDLGSFKHRPGKKKGKRGRDNRINTKVRALELQQQQLLKSQAAELASTNNDDNPGEGADVTSEDAPDDENDGEDPLSSPKEPQLIRLVRTINSIRAISPHLLQIFNHKRRNDKNLKIGSAAWKAKKHGFCWLLGSHVFDCSGSRGFIGCYQDLTLVLQGFLPVEMANRIAKDPLGGSVDFWKKEWISALRARASPTIVDPLTLLQSIPNAPSWDTMLEAMKNLDTKLHQDSTDASAAEIQSKYDAAVQKLQQTVSTILKQKFPEARLSIYGSCLSNLSLGKGADVDLSLWLPEAHQLQHKFQSGSVEAQKYERQMKQYVYRVFHKLNQHRCGAFGGMQPVTRARVPVVKGTYKDANNPYSVDGSINFDICFLNDIAVANSGLMREYSMVDPRVRKLMMAVKQWAKEHNINSAQFNCISSYAWINLVIFYLQCVGFLPNLQDPALMDAVSFVPDPEVNFWHSINKLETWYLTWEQVCTANAWSIPSEYANVPTSALLYGFFEFYSRRFPRSTFSISIAEGNIQIPKLESNNPKLFLSIEDPFETFDSHCPHDLGVPAAEVGTRDIFKYLGLAEKHLRRVLLGEIESNLLWPAAPANHKKDAPQAQTLPVKQPYQNTGKAKERVQSAQKQDTDNGGIGQGRGAAGGNRRGGRGRGRGPGRGRGGNPGKPNLPKGQIANGKSATGPPAKQSGAKSPSKSQPETENKSSSGIESPQEKPNRNGGRKIKSQEAFDQSGNGEKNGAGGDPATPEKKRGGRNRNRRGNGAGKQKANTGGAASSGIVVT